MILKTDGSLWTCGYNRYGQLGDGTTIDSYTPIKIAERGNVAVTDITLDKTSLSLGVGESYRLTATVLPSNASQDVTWSSEDETIATVAEFDGTVTGVKAGTTTIGAVTDDGMHVAICQVTVTGDDSDDPLIFTAESTNGVPMTFKIISEAEGTCQIGTGSGAAISGDFEGKVVLPKVANGYRVTAIAANAFAGTGVGTVIIPNTIESIGEKAFYGCGLLDYVESYIEQPFDIPTNVFSGIASNAMLEVLYDTKSDYLSKSGWNGFSEIDNNTAIVNGILYFLNEDNKSGTAWVERYIWEKYEGDADIPETFTIDGTTFTVVGIDDRAFKESNITSVNIPRTVKSIDSHAFAECKSLEEGGNGQFRVAYFIHIPNAADIKPVLTSLVSVKGDLALS